MKPPELRDMGAKTKPRAQTAQKRIPESILILADIEGSSGCHTREAARFMGKGWPQACLDMTLDLNAVVEALFNSGVGRIHIQDFHRTGYNIIPRLVHDNATLSQGYRQGHVPGMGNVRHFQGLIMLGMHAP
ncbi:MAG: M55 family metallopeptidase [Desulfobacter sp.]|nr:M55 family metallopeptidase [Desulfobacter sp.]WDP87114.1 MAG: M55 family metallopeptidase [Desulfobacter sp.]